LGETQWIGIWSTVLCYLTGRIVSLLEPVVSTMIFMLRLEVFQQFEKSFLLAPILFLCLASSNISKVQFQKEAYHLLFPFPFATACCKIFYALRRVLHHAKDFVAQRMSSRREFCCVVEFITQWVVAHGMLSRIGCCCAMDFVAQRMLRTMDSVAHRMFPCSGFYHA
jgi:hypothetical protein